MKTTKLFSVILFASLFIGISTIFAGCHMRYTHGNGNVVKQDRTVSSFNGIDVSGAFDVYLKQGDNEAVTVEAEENLLPYIRTEVVDGTLIIETKDRPFHNTTKMTVYVTIKGLKSIDLSGATDIETQNKLNLSDLKIDISGASEAKLDFAVQKLNLDCSGASKILLTGSAVNVTMDLSGASKLLAFDMPAESYSISLSGAGKAEINVSKKLSADISGAGTIKYKGSPAEIDQEVSGAGSIKKVD